MIHRHLSYTAISTTLTDVTTLAEYVERFAGLTDLRVSIPTMHRMLRRLESTRCDGRPRAFVGVAQEDADAGNARR